MKRLDVVKPRQHAGAAMRNVGAEGRQIRPHVAHQIDIHREKLAVFRQRHPRDGDVITALRVAHEVIGAVGGPLDVLAQLLRGDRSERVFTVRKQFRTKAAADIRADHPHLLDRNLQDVLAQDVTQAVAALAADRQRQMIPLGVVLADHRARFHVIGDHARVDDRHFSNGMRLCKRGLGRFLVADRHIEQHIAGVIRPDLRRALFHRVGDADHGGQRRPVYLDRFDGVAGLVDGLCDDKGHGVADMAHFSGGQDRIGRTRERIDFQIEQARKISEILDVVRRKNCRDARQPARARGVDGKFRAGMRRAQHQRMKRRRRMIIGVAALAANEGVVFLAKHALTDAEFDGGHHISDFQT